MFGRKKKEADKNLPSQVTPAEPVVSSKLINQIHVMPERFYIAEKKGSNKIFIVIGIIIIFFGIMVVAAILIYKSMLNRGDAVLVNENVNENTNVASSPTPLLTPTPAVTPTPTPTPSPTPNPTPTPTATPASLGSEDVDGDKLTSNEEKIFSTSEDNSDTDQDGFRDGDEILNGFDPTKANTTLLDSGMIQEYKNQELKFSVLYPSRWLVKDLNLDAGKQIIFDTKIGERVEVVAKSIPQDQRVSLQDYALKDDSSLQSNDLTKVAVNNLQGLKARGDLKYYFSTDDFSIVYIISYVPLEKEKLNFATTFKMMINSFKPVQ